MKNNEVSANELYTMVRKHYLSAFPYKVSELEQRRSNSDKFSITVYTKILSEWLGNNGVYATIQYLDNKTYNITANSDEILEHEKTLILDKIEVFKGELNSIMEDIVALHKWLVSENYITSSSDANGKEKYIMTTKFIDKKTLIL